MTVKKVYILSHRCWYHTQKWSSTPETSSCKRNTLNLHVNNWAFEIESFKIKFVHIAGKDNVITDTLSRLIDIDPDIEPELKDYEFGSYCFETLPKAKRSSVAEKLALSWWCGCMWDQYHIWQWRKIHQIPSKCPLSNEKIFLNYRSEMRKIKNLRVRINNGKYSDFYKIEKWHFIPNGGW